MIFCIVHRGWSVYTTVTAVVSKIGCAPTVWDEYIFPRTFFFFHTLWMRETIG